MVVDATTSKALKVGSTFPGRDPEALVPMRSIYYPARDGTQIPGYLSMPVGSAATQLPLIVMPHGGPIARDDLGLFLPARVSREPRLCGAADEFSRLERLRRRNGFLRRIKTGAA